MTLKHYNKDAFSLVWGPDEGETRVFFHFDAENKPYTRVVEFLQEEGAGTFVRKDK